MDTSGLKPTAKATAHLTGFKLSASDQLDLIILSANDFTTSRVAPYLGWAHLFGRAKANLDMLRSVVGYRNLTRVAVRYINRLDIPSALNERIDPSIYLNNLPVYPGVTVKSFSEFSNQAIFDIQSIPAIARVGANGAPSPLIDHKSLMLDIDVFCWQNLPNKPNTVYELLEFLHQTKNSIFEACITDKARELFDRA